jgi:hypothetical protein
LKSKKHGTAGVGGVRENGENWESEKHILGSKVNESKR